MSSGKYRPGAGLKTIGERGDDACDDVSNSKIWIFWILLRRLRGFGAYFSLVLSSQYLERKV